MNQAGRWRMIIVGGHTRSIGKTQLVCDLISALPEAQWVAGKITQYGHGVCAQNGTDCDCAPDDHVCALSWETRADSGTDSARFLGAGARRSFWLRTKQGYLAEGMPLLRSALGEPATAPAGRSVNVLIETNSLLQFVRPALYLFVLDPQKHDFKESARLHLDRSNVLILRRPLTEILENQSPWPGISAQLLGTKPAHVQELGRPLPSDLVETVRQALENPLALSSNL